jgi:UDP-N-acetylmuramyl pentapeptide phosphotransferase/UDP-N-acetylglucosamine-1-phosphate transferase
MRPMKRISIATLALSLIVGCALIFERSGRLFCVCAAFAMSLIMTRHSIPNIFVVSYRKKLYDQPDGRRLHSTPTPRLGGLLFFPVICCSVIMAVSFHAMLIPDHLLPSLCSVIWICPLIFIFMTGVIDDLIGVRAFAKLLTHIVAGVLLVWSGLWIDNFGGLLGIHDLSPWVGKPLTVVFVVAVINAVNMIDGADGLAAGLCIIAFLIYGLYSYMGGGMLLPLIAAAALGTLTPFFYANVRGLGSRRHKMFMGDTGSQTMGFIIGIFATMLITNGDGTPVGRNFVLALSPLIVPVFDLVHVAVFRLARGHHPFLPDKTHIHHRLIGKGFSPRQAVTLIIALAVVYTLVNMSLARRIDVTLIFVADMVLWGAFNSKLVSVRSIRVKQSIQSSQSSQTTKTTNFN